ncbi:hypothetical protein Vafri_7463 [Volvox africanus]|uniref:Uncharacterized protein n=1 Tax=Volvox africanus TaxID=51714 RepID=A0A8J4EY33_9CHLO|nr:hypothetical protein Vafri_7463 [Volvox africanus]
MDLDVLPASTEGESEEDSRVEIEDVEVAPRRSGMKRHADCLLFEEADGGHSDGVVPPSTPPLPAPPRKRRSISPSSPQHTGPSYPEAESEADPMDVDVHVAEVVEAAEPTEGQLATSGSSAFDGSISSGSISRGSVSRGSIGHGSVGLGSVSSGSVSSGSGSRGSVGSFSGGDVSYDSGRSSTSGSCGSSSP